MIHLLLLCFVGLSCSDPDVIFDLEQADVYFKEFMATHQKEYQSLEEHSMRFEIFKNNLHNINQKNQDSKLAKFGITRFTDLSIDEFHQMYSGLIFGDKDECTLLGSGMRRGVRGPAPESLDFRQENKVTRVKNQGQCGSCWAFSTTGTLEGQYAIKHNELLEFSEQQLVDCENMSHGCFGGLMTYALMYLKENGAMLEADYPYKALQVDCRYKSNKVVAKVTKCFKHEVQDENELKQVLYDNGPLAIAIDASDILAYKGGILEQCNAGYLNHGVLLVGYGKEQGEEYWIVKNSWDTNYGEEGYLKVKMHINACNMTSFIISSEVA